MDEPSWFTTTKGFSILFRCSSGKRSKDHFNANSACAIFIATLTDPAKVASSIRISSKATSRCVPIHEPRTQLSHPKNSTRTSLLRKRLHDEPHRHLRRKWHSSDKDLLLFITKTNHKKYVSAAISIVDYLKISIQANDASPLFNFFCDGDTMIFQGCQFHFLDCTDHLLPISGLTTSIDMKRWSRQCEHFQNLPSWTNFWSQFLQRRSTLCSTILIQDDKSICNDRVKGLASTVCTIISSIYLLKHYSTSPIL